MKLGRVLVVGAGIGGLSVANALRERAEVVVIDRAPTFAPVGAGIVLAANAVRALRRCGVEAGPAGCRLDAFELRTASGGLLSVIHPSEVAPEWPAKGVHRAALHEALIGAAGARIELRAGTRLTSFQDRGDAVEVELDGRPDRFDGVIGADGLHSQVREALGGPGPVYSGYTCWRAVVDEPGRSAACEWWGRGRRFGAVPIDAGRTYVYLTRNAPAGTSARVEDFDALVAEFEPEVRALVTRIDPAQVLHHDLSALAGATWGAGRVWLLGDAAHATLPNEGQGAAMAIEDALALAAALDGEATPAAALARYAAVRDARVRKIQRDSRALGWVGQWDQRWAVAVRDKVMAAVPNAWSQAQLRSVVEPGLTL